MKKVALVFLIIALIGFADALYLTAKHYSATPITCSLIEGCDRVTTSTYATIGGVPVALLGVFYYAVAALGAWFFLYRTAHRAFMYVMHITPFGFFASVYFVYLQLVVIGAICIYCMISALASAALFVLDVYAYMKYRHMARV